jgi:hypothetical protein
MENSSTSLKRVLSILVLGASCAIAAPAAPAGPRPSPGNQEEVNRQLMQRLQELEDEVKQLKDQAAAPASVQPPAPTPPLAAAPTPAPAPVSQSSSAPEVNEVAPRLHLEVFGDVGAQVYSHNPDTFLFGSLDLLMTAHLSDKSSTLAEVLFIAENDNSARSSLMLWGR